MATFKTASDIEASLTADLFNVDPSMDTSVRSPLNRAFIGPFSRELSKIYWQDKLTNDSQDPANLTGDALDKRAGNWGKTRGQGTQATGYVTLLRTTPADKTYVIPAGIQIGTLPTLSSPTVWVTTTVQAMLPLGSTSVTVAAQANVAGTSGNVVAGSLVVVNTPIAGISKVRNDAAFVGGTDAQSDDDFRKQWLSTVFSNTVGSPDYYLEAAYKAGFSRAVFLTPQMIKTDQAEFVDTTWGGEQVTVALVSEAGAYLGSEFVEPLDRGTYYVSPADYTFNAPNEYSNGLPYLQSKDHSKLSAGRIVLVTYEYLPQQCRGVGKLDMYVEGGSVGAGSDAFVYKTGTSNYVLAKQPVVALPSTITVGTVLYTEGVDYILEHDEGTSSGSIYGRDSIKWLTPLLDDTEFTVMSYEYNQTVRDLQQQLLLSTSRPNDGIAVHSGRSLGLVANIDVILKDGTFVSDVFSTCQDALTKLFIQLSGEAVVQFSDMQTVLTDKSNETLARIDALRVTSVVDTLGVTHLRDWTTTPDQFIVLQNLAITQKTITSW